MNKVFKLFWGESVFTGEDKPVSSIQSQMKEILESNDNYYFISLIYHHKSIMTESASLIVKENGLDGLKKSNKNMAMDINERVKNKITEKTGTVTGRAEYAYRVNQLLILYDEKKEEIWEEETVFEKENS